MIDFSKRMQSKAQNKRINPIEIYDNLDRTTQTGPLRPEQRRILEKWYTSRKSEKDLIIKLHTGAGKTLIGLLIAQSYINAKEGPAIYICPNFYLMQQACAEAKKFGIPYCIVQHTNEIPDEFTQGKTILITYVQKVFNGLSIFGVGNNSQKVGCLILDDSHACIDSINNACTIKVESQSPAFDELVRIFENDLKQQGEGSYQDFQNGNHNIILPVPYWSWQNQISQVTEILARNSGDNNIKFAWQLLKNDLVNCNAYIAPSKIEITPYCIPIEKFGIFSNATHRILMSATTQEDTLFIKGLGLSIDAVTNPLIDEEYSWSGEKMILIPDQICEQTNEDQILEKIMDIPHEYGIVALTPSFDKAKKYQAMGAVLANESGSSPQVVYSKVDTFKGQPQNGSLVFANRYDGIDLPDNTCRILIMDSVPYYDSLSDRYEMQCRPNSEIVRVKIVQKIEQGLGRSVRGEKDYSVILIVGSDLIKYLRSINNRSLFSPQTQKQIEIGFDIVEMSKEDQTNTDEFSLLFSTMNQCLKRDEGWKEYYAYKMNEVETETAHTRQLYEVLRKEREVYDAIRFGEYDKGCAILQDIINQNLESPEKGWYLQNMAKFKYHISKNEANKLQIAAFKANNEMMKPLSGITYNKVLYPVNDSRVHRIISELKQYKTYDEFQLFLSEQLSNLSFGVSAEKFEKAVDSIGGLLGYKCQRPDKEIRMGPDNLWCVGPGQYILFECKSEVLEKRGTISKHEAGQVEEHMAWFREEYHDAQSKIIMLIPTRNLAKDAFFSETSDVRIIRKKGLNEIKRLITGFFREFKQYALDSLTTATVSELLSTHNLTDISYLKQWTDKPQK